MTQQLFSVSDAAQRLAVRPQTIRKWMSAGKISFTKIGRRSLIEQETIVRLIEAGRRPAVSSL